MAVPSIAAVPGGLASARRGDRVAAHRDRRPAGTSRAAGYFFVALYVALLLLLGIGPAVYAIYLALTKSTSGWSFRWLRVELHRRFQRLSHRVGVRAHRRIPCTVAGQSDHLRRGAGSAAAQPGTTRRHGVQIPLLHSGRSGGAASVVVWLFMLDPTASPFAFVLHWFGLAQFDNTIAPGHLPSSSRSWRSGRVQADGSW